jgi:hypothetical protein
MTEYTADNQLGANVAKKVGMDPQSSVSADSSRDLGTEERLILGATSNPGE